MTWVTLGEPVDYGTLETAVLKAAKDIGWKASVEDEYATEYNLGSVEERKKYDCTTIYLRKGGFLGIGWLPMMRVTVFSKDKPGIDRFAISSDSLGGYFAQKADVLQYLNAVSQNLRSARQPVLEVL